MKTLRLGAHVQEVAVIFMMTAILGLFAALPANAQTVMEKAVGSATVNGITCRYNLKGQLPSSSAQPRRGYSLWNNMHPHTYDGTIQSYVNQCELSIGRPSWLTKGDCEVFKNALHTGQCAVVTDVNHINLDSLRGKTQDRKPVSTVFLNQKMNLKEGRQAIFVQLDEFKWVGVFAGEPGKSCNNFFAIRDVNELPPVVKTPEPPPPVVIREKRCRFIRQEVKAVPGIFTHVEGVKVCDTYIPGFTGVTPSGTQTSSQLVCE